MKLPKIKLNLILTLLLSLILIWELYLAYAYIFRNLTQESKEVTPNGVVRVNLESYGETIEFLEKQENFTPGSINLKRGNPFRP